MFISFVGSMLFMLMWAGVALGQAPEYKPGETWTYSAIEKRDEWVVSKQSRSGFGSGEYKMEILENGALKLDETFAAVMPSLYESKPTISGIDWLAFPLEVGKTWQVKWYIRSQKWSIGTVKVIGEETVKVPAGEFPSYKLIITSESWVEWLYWYSPQAKAVVQMTQKQFRKDGSVSVIRTAELTGFTVRH